MRPFYILLSLICMFTACRSRMSSSEDQALSEQVKADPEQALRQIDSLLLQSPASPLSDERQLQLRQWRQEAFDKLGNADSVFEEALRVQSLAGHLGDSLAYARALLPVKGDIEESKFKYLEDVYPVAIGIFSRRQLHREQATLMSSEAALLNNLGDYTGSQQLAMSAIALPAMEQRDTLMAVLYHTIANNFLGIYTLEKSRVYFMKALDIARKLNDSLMQSKVFMDMGIMHYNMHTDSARYHYQRAMDILPVENGKLQRIKILYNISVQDFEAERYPKALEGFRYLLSVSQKEDIPTGEVVAYKALGFYHEANGDPDSAVSFLERSVRMADSIGQPFMKIQGQFELAKAYRTAGLDDQAFALHQETDAIQDSMLKVDTKNVIHGLEMRFNTERMSLENKNLKKDLYIRKGWIIFLTLLSMAFVALVWLVRQRSRLSEARAHSYAVLMERYKAEKFAAEDALKDAATHAGAGPQPVVAAKKTSRDLSGSDPIYVDLQHLFQVKAVYKDPKLRIEDVAQWLNVTPRQISAVLKARLNLTFIQYVNQYRIREARRLIEDPGSVSLKLEAIGEMCGIPTRTYFHKLFESIVGVSPGHYRRNIHDMPPGEEDETQEGS